MVLSFDDFRRIRNSNRLGQMADAEAAAEAKHLPLVWMGVRPELLAPRSVEGRVYRLVMDFLVKPSGD